MSLATIGALALWTLNPAAAAEPGWGGQQLSDAEVRVYQAEQERTAPTGTTPPVASLDTAEAEELGLVTEDTLRFLKPRRVRLPQNPYASTDFTAYTLEWGEWKVGLASVTVGALPRTQLGTVPSLNVLGIYNASAKFNLARVGPLDLAVGGSTYHLPVGDFRGSQTNLTGTLSLRVLNPWSVHVSGSYASISAQGIPDLTRLPPVVLSAAGNPDLRGVQQQVDQYTEGAELDAHARALTLRAATDLRLNRRDSVVLQGSAMVWGSAEMGVNQDLPPILGLDKALDQETEGTLPVKDTYVASLAWQLQWRRAELRLGAGVSSVPGAWLLQSTDFSWRFGGKTKREERVVRRGWKRNKRVVNRSERKDMPAPDAA